MTLTKRRPTTAASRLRSRCKQRILSAQPLRLKQARSFTWVVIKDAKNVLSDLGTKQQRSPPATATTVDRHSYSSHSTGHRQLPSNDMLFRYVERVSLRKLSRTTQHVLSTTDSVDSATHTAISTTQTPSLSTLSMRHGHRRWCLVRQCLVKARAYTLSREMQRKEQLDLERLGITNTELATVTNYSGRFKNHYEEEKEEREATITSIDSWWGPIFSEEHEALQLWSTTANGIKQQEARRQRMQPLATPLYHPIPTVAAGGPLSATVCCTSTSDIGYLDNVVKPPSPPQSPPAIESRQPGITTVG